jgi:RimJ/RimL family protein N-acetyltransferase
MQLFPELDTNRLKLRKIALEDVPALVKYANNKEVAKNILNIPYPYHEPDAVFRIRYVHEGFKNKSRFVFAIVLKETRKLIGEISLHIDNSKNMAQLGYWIGKPFRNKGIATEAAEVILKFGFTTLHLNAIYAECHAENKASEKVLINNKMLKIGVSGMVIQYGLSKQEFDEQRRTTHQQINLSNM